MAKKKSSNGFSEYKELFLHQFTEHTKALNHIEESLNQLRKDVLETSIPSIKTEISSIKGQAKAWAIIISLMCGGAVSAAVALLR